MDPVGPWTAAYAASYNRLAGAAGSFQPTTGSSGEFPHHLTATTGNTVSNPSTTSQHLLLQAAHATPTLAGLSPASSSPAFNPGGFLTPSPVGYDTVFTPFLHHANQKAHYTQALNAAQHRQAIANSKPVDSDTLRDNYSTVHHQALAPNPAFFDQAPPSVQSSTIAWTHQNSSQLPSPFGVLPHESVVGNNPGGPSTKLTSAYENFNAAHFAAAQTLNHINSQIVAASYSDTSKKLISKPLQSPPLKHPLTLSVTSSSNYLQQNSSSSYSRTENSSSVPFQASKTLVVTTKSEYNANKAYSNIGVSSPAQPQQPRNISTTTSINSVAKDYNMSSTTVFPTRAQDKHSSKSTDAFQSPITKNTISNTTLHSKLQSNSERRDGNHESSQSSPISFAMIDSAQQRSTTSKISTPSRPIANNSVQQTQLQQQLLSHQKSGSYRGFPSSTGSTPESEYNLGTVNRNSSSTDGGYSSSSSVGPSSVDCNTLQRSPLNHSQQSPLGHVTSPGAYPIYHSPMTSMSSPSPVQHPEQNGTYMQNPSPQVAPASPLDASLPRPSSVGQVGYSSVITRNDQNYPNDRNVGFPQKQCWETAENQLTNHNAKFPGYAGDVSANSNKLAIQQQQRAMLGISEKQQMYFDSGSTQINRAGDPMSIVKNLQSLQQQCQAPQILTPEVDIKPIVEQSKLPAKSSCTSMKRKKSSENKIDTGIIPTEFVNRIPPPAHLNINQSQQNGGYLEIDRWNLPASHKIPNANPNSFVSQNSPHTSGNFLKPTLTHQNVTAQPQYYQSFHNLPASQQVDSALQNNTGTSTVPLNASCSNSEANILIETPKSEGVAKVIVPDVEEELGFLSESPKVNQLPDSEKNDKLKPKDVKPVIPFSNPNSGFMASYIKFLQGEKEPSPPVKHNPVKAVYIPTKTKTKENDTPKQSAKSRRKSSPSSQSVDFEDDPRYFPLPKDSSSRKLDTSSDSDMTDYELLIPKTTHRPGDNKRTLQENSNKKDTRRKNSSSNIRRKRKRNTTSDEDEGKRLPLRNTAQRRAKDKLSTLSVDDDNDDDDNNDNDSFSDFSDSDPAWTPAESKPSDDETYGRRRSSRGKRKTSVKQQKTPPSRFLESSDEEKNSSQNNSLSVKNEDADYCNACNNSFDEDPKDKIKCCDCKMVFHSGCCNVQTVQKLRRLGSRRNFWKCDDCKPLDTTGEYKKSTKKNNQSKKNSKHSGGKSMSRARSLEDTLEASLGTEEYFPFKSGEFIVIKTDLKEDFPPIWRVDGKTLLQKYEPFDQNGEKLYRNISTYSGWTPHNKNIYQKIPVQFIVQTRTEIIVKFLRSEMVDPAQEQAFLEQSLSETANYQDNFEVYIQTLISQALDSNFLAEIFAERDEYFLQNVEVIDNLTEERRLRLVAALDWPLDNSIQRSITTWPCYNVLADLKASSIKLCDACTRRKVHARIILYGQPYNATTLDGMTPDPNIINEKDFMICLDCIKWVQLYNKLVHQKYIMYIECAKRVAEKRSTDPNKDTTVILNELLADEEWLNKLFRQVRVNWAEIEKAEREKNKKLGITVLPIIKKIPQEKGTTSDTNKQPDNPIEKNTGEVLAQNKDDETEERELIKEIKVENEVPTEEEDEGSVDNEYLETGEHSASSTNKGQSELVGVEESSKVITVEGEIEKIPKEP